MTTFPLWFPIACISDTFAMWCIDHGFFGNDGD